VVNSPTFTSPAMTVRGMILGTAAYMSPEQARGKPVDKRADIWAFGVVLHEMLTGRPLFAGESVSDTMAAVLRAEVDLGALPAVTPDNVRRLLERCLQRDPRMRLRDIGDARIELEPAALSEMRPLRVVQPRISLLPAFAMFAAGAAIALLAAFG
jgi:serine/threonine protein kinase